MVLMIMLFTVPDYPCDNLVDSDGKVYNASLKCWTCKNAKDSAACYEDGQFETCTQGKVNLLAVTGSPQAWLVPDWLILSSLS